MSDRTVVADLTAMSPAVQETDGERTRLWPSYCLPWFHGEPPIVGDAARLHRRASNPFAIGMEERLDLKARGRFLLAEGWLAMIREPDSIDPSNVRFAWEPVGSSWPVGTEFPSVVEAYLAQWCDRDLVLALVVPDGLGPGAKEELRDQLEPRFRRLLFVPRTIAGALSWCKGENRGAPSDNTESRPSSRVGGLLVTTTSADVWEAAVVPIRSGGERGEAGLFPVHARVDCRSELGVLGFIRNVPAGAEEAALSEEDYWRNWLIDDPSGTRAGDPPRLVDGANRAAFEAGRVRWSDMDRGQPEGALLDVLGAVEKEAANGSILGWVHFGNREEDLHAMPFSAIGDRAGILPIRHTADMLLDGATEALRRLNTGQVPYYESLAQVDLCVEGRNRYQDPTQEWRPLIEATEVPVGTRYQSPVPISDLALPEGLTPEIELFVRSARRGGHRHGYKLVSQDEPLETQERVLIRATTDPGQGMARFEIKSEKEGLFFVSVREDRLEAIDGPPELTYGWPPGSAWVISHWPMMDSARRTITRGIDQARRQRLDTKGMRQIRDETNKWIRPEQEGIRLDTLEYPRDLIHEAFVYLGAFPSSTGEVGETSSRYGNFLIEDHKNSTGGTDSKRSIWSASWLYLACPKYFLDMTRNALGDFTVLNDAHLACAGNCFSTIGDYRAFFQALSISIRQGLLPDDKHWIRAYRNLARFRADSLRLDVFSRRDQSLFLSWYMDVFLSATADANSDSFLHCVYLAPHILKRRRYDPDFLRPGSAENRQFRHLLERALEAASARRETPAVTRHIKNLECAIKFLANTATQATLQVLGATDSA
jgi:hypothetical protein